jgi:hypothetical protein
MDRPAREQKGAKFREVPGVGLASPLEEADGTEASVDGATDRERSVVLQRALWPISPRHRLEC